MVKFLAKVIKSTTWLVHHYYFIIKDKMYLKFLSILFVFEIRSALVFRGDYDELMQLLTDIKGIVSLVDKDE